MQRVTVTVEENVLALARADVEAGREASVSAWVADAMTRKARARTELSTELDQMALEHPYDRETADWVAAAIGRSPAWVTGALAIDPAARS